MDKAKNLALLIIIAFCNGMIPVLMGSTLFVWLKEQGLNLHNIGLYSLANFPIALSFVFSALLEYGAKRKIINHKYTITTSLIISSALIYYLPHTIDNQQKLFVVCFILSICITISRIILLAIQKVLFADEKIVSVINISTICFKIGLLIGGSLALYLSQYYAWQTLYHTFAIIILGCTLIIFFVTEQNLLINNYNIQQHSIIEQIIAPFKDLLQLPAMSLILLLMFFYRAPDNLITHYFDLFYLHFGLTKTDVALGYKLYGMITASIGGIICIKLIKNNSYIINLQLALCLHLISYFMIYYFSITQAPLWAFYVCVTCEEFTRGMTMIMFWSFQTHICKRQHVLIQLAVITAIDSLSYTLLGTLAGTIIDKIGYSNFMLIVIASFAPAILILCKLKSIKYYND